MALHSSTRTRTLLQPKPTATTVIEYRSRHTPACSRDPSAGAHLQVNCIHFPPAQYWRANVQDCGQPLPSLQCTMIRMVQMPSVRRRRGTGGGNHRLILVSATLFIFITWVRPSLLSSQLSIHTLQQHLVIDVVRLYIAFHKSETEQGAELFYIRVTSMTSIMKTSVYLVETIVSDLFIVRVPFFRSAFYRSGCTSSYIGAISYGTRAFP